MPESPQKILIAGAGGTLGLRLTRRLSSRGHEVVGLTRSAARRAQIEAAGGRGLACDALVPDVVRTLVMRDRRDQIVNLLTALPAEGALRAAQLEATNRLRREATANLLQAGVDVGVRRVVAESFVAVWGDVSTARPLAEEDPLGSIRPGDPLGDTVRALRDLERWHLEAADRRDIDTVVLRYGFLYGPGVPSAEVLMRNLRRGTAVVPRLASGGASWIHIDDAISATQLVIESADPARLYQVCDDGPMGIAEAVDAARRAVGARRPLAVPGFILRLVAPVVASMASKYLAMSNGRLARELRWRPRFASVREGFAHLGGHPRKAA